MLTKMIETLKKNPRTIVFTEGTDNRILDAADKLTAEGILGVILLGKEEEVKAAAKAGNYNIEKCSIIDPEGYPEMDAMVAEMVKLRKGKMTEEQCQKALSQSNYFGTMLVKMGKADCLLGGATYSTADTVRPALQLIKTKPGNKIVSSCFILVRGDEKIAMGDCAINIDPSEDDLVEIAIESAKTAFMTFESIFSPSFRLKSPSQSFTAMDKSRITMDTRLNVISSGFRIFPIESFKNVNPTSITRKETTRAAIYSILPCPKG